MNLFTLDGRTLESFGLIPAPGHLNPALPATRDLTLQVAGRDGLYYFGSTIAERQFQFPLVFPYEPDRIKLQEKVRALVDFLLDSKGRPRELQLEFDYDVGIAYTVRLLGSVDVERIFSTGQFTLTLVAYDPFAYSIDSTDGIVMDSSIPLDSEIRLDDTYSFAVSGDTTFEINNFGTMDEYPAIEVTGSFTTLSIAANGKTFGFTEAIANQTLAIDGKKKTVKIGNVNKLGKMTGDFIELLRGINTVTVSGSGLNCTVSFIFKPKFK